MRQQIDPIGRRTGPGRASALLVLCAVTAACQPSTTALPVQSAPTVTESASSTPAASPVKTEVGPGYAPFGHFLYKRPFNTPEDPRVDGPIDLYVIGHGHVLLRAASLFPERNIVTESYTSIGTADRPLIAAAVQIRDEARGLEPQRFITLIAAVDPAAQTVLHAAEVLRSDTAAETAPKKLTGSPAGTAAAFSTETSTALPGRTFSFDAMNGAKLWESQGWIEGPVLGAVTVIKAGSGTQSGGKEPCEVAIDIEVATGKTLHTLESASLGTPCPHIEVISIDNNGGSPQQAEKQKYVRITASTSEKQSTYEALTGQERTLPATVVAVDPHSDLVFPLGRVSDRNSQRVEPFGVLDTATGKPAWTLDAQKAYQLGATVRALYDGKVYLKTTDQEPVVDLATGKTISDNDPRYPIGAVDTWTYWSDGTLEKKS